MDPNNVVLTLFENYVLEAYKGQVTETQKFHIKAAFYAGIKSYLDLMMEDGVLSGGDECSPADEALQECIYQELERFGIMINKTEGSG